ncbi:hypothetical protein HN499_05165 [archaeon]|nr:hypothetical protein [archaeon]MBT7024875.1 hypothetical protein [archaeon]
MEIDIVIKYDELNRDGSRRADNIRRDIQERFPNAVWERYGEGHRILI